MTTTTTTNEVYGRLARGVNLDDDSADAALRITASYEPIGGWSDKLSPPTYPTDRDHPVPYVLEERFVGGDPVNVVLLDSRQSQANRCEEALQAAIDAGRFFLPHLRLDLTSNGRSQRITSLTAPHRSCDAYFRDSESAQGERFDLTSVGAALAMVSQLDADPLLRHSPTDLAYGMWGSNRQLRLATKFPRVYTSEIVGRGEIVGSRAAGRADMIVSGADRAALAPDGSWTLLDKETKGSKRLSELGHGSIPPSFIAAGGVSVRAVSRVATIGFAGIARIGFASLDDEAARAARTLLACIALVGDRLAFARPGLFLRSGCELTLLEESLTWVGTGDALLLDRSGAVDLLAHAIDQLGHAGVAWATEPVRLVPGKQLQRAIDKAFFSNPATEDE